MSKLPLQLLQKGGKELSKYHSVEEIKELYSDTDALDIIKDMMEKEVLRVIKFNQEASANDIVSEASSNDIVSASNAGYVTGIMWVKGELAKIEEALKTN